MSDLVRQDTLLGGPKTIVGNVTLDLVLETLGTLYVKLQNTFTNLIEYIENQILNNSNSYEAVTVISGISNYNVDDYSDGTFIYDSSTSKLYIVFDSKFNLVANIKSSSTISDDYIKSDGTVPMKATLQIDTTDVPLKIISSSEIENLNSNYLLGHTANEFAQKTIDEEIKGLWTFSKNITAKANIRLSGDLITDGSLGSPAFASGMTGYGWRMDATTNTLTIDNLVVRGILSVFELVVNKITATNGSLWVTDSFKSGNIQKILEIELSLLSDDLSTLSIFDTLSLNSFIIFYTSTYNYQLITNKPVYNNNGTIKENSEYKVYTKIYRYNKQIEDFITLEDAIELEYLIPEELYGTEIVYSNDSEDAIKTTLLLFSKFDNATFEFVASSDVSNYEYSLEAIRINYLYYSYFGNNTIYFIKPDEDSDYPTFKSGDILLCQKFDGSQVKKYNSIVLTTNQYGIIILLASSALDYYTTIEYDSSGNVASFTQTKSSDSDTDNIAIPQQGDSLIKIGNIFNPERRGSLYLTSSEQDSPRMDILDGIFRPDYNVLYYIPKYETFKTGIYTYYIQSSGSIPENNSNLLWAVNPDNSELIGCRYITGNEIKVTKSSTETNIYVAEITKNVKVRIGNLNNIFNEVLGTKQPHGYGLYGENVFLTGDFYLNNGTAVADISADGILLEFKNAGLAIEDDTENGGTQIELTADKIKFKTTDGGLVGMFSGNTFNTLLINADELDVNKIIAYKTYYYYTTSDCDDDHKISINAPYMSINENNNGLIILYGPPIIDNLYDAFLKSQITIPSVSTLPQEYYEGDAYCLTLKDSITKAYPDLSSTNVENLITLVLINNPVQLIKTYYYTADNGVKYTLHCPILKFDLDAQGCITGYMINGSVTCYFSRFGALINTDSKGWNIESI